MLVIDILDHYFREHVAVKVVARERVEYSIQALKSFFENDEELRDVDIPRCRKYRAHRHRVKDSTVRLELTTLQAAANHCLLWRHITEEEMPVIELPRAGAPKTLWLTKDEAGRLSQAAKETSERAYRFVVLAYYTAGRKTSIETLRWDQVDLKAARINLAKHGERRTNKHRPILPALPEMAERLQQWWRDRQNDTWVLDHDGDIRYEFDKAATLAGLAVLTKQGLREAGKLTPHILRHTRATHLLQDGKPPFAVANLLGDNVQTVLRVYGHACPDYMAEALS